jgi:hypothetical protein
MARFRGYLPVRATYWSGGRRPGFKRRLGAIFSEKSLKISAKKL